MPAFSTARSLRFAERFSTIFFERRRFVMAGMAIRSSGHDLDAGQAGSAIPVG